ncbi:hypothetical protein EJ03DRAFT_338514 [Teratosphaeria nubilosa]|uniref:MJ1316 RNA cyclic group end recognition domain-containing protein n=1 Tax=Teratosphaeria nubilosa TaxID=161662 RepID=A0A6G1KZY8_9PEZI|nr:hypothetical protein EJ03DRAFT_338514 [Teratosphaeria nubilosa]
MFVYGREPITIRPPNVPSERSQKAIISSRSRLSAGAQRHNGGVDYDVGYRDRFMEDLQWMSVEQWGDKPTEHEEFIPESRIFKIRRSSDGVVVWDRAARLDIT